MPASPRHWFIGGLTTVGLLAAVVVLNDSGDHAFDLRTISTSSTSTSSTSTSSSTSDVMLERVEPSTTSSTTTTTLPPATTAAPVTVAAAPPAPAAPPADPNGYTGCYTWSPSRITEVRRGAGQGSVGAGGNLGACRWALALAKADKLSHSGLPCKGTGGQVVGLYGSTGGRIDPNAPAVIIENWFKSPSHYTALTYPTFTRIDLQFITKTRPDGSWTVYGVGNLCP